MTKDWKTKDGERIAICDLDDDHLMKIIEMFSDENRVVCGGSCSGDDFDPWCDVDPPPKGYSECVEEARKRGLI